MIVFYRCFSRLRPDCDLVLKNKYLWRGTVIRLQDQWMGVSPVHIHHAFVFLFGCGAFVAPDYHPQLEPSPCDI